MAQGPDTRFDVILTVNQMEGLEMSLILIKISILKYLLNLYRKVSNKPVANLGFQMKMQNHELRFLFD